MNQILHIFKKDARRHWPEILISLVLLALFTHHQLHPWQNETRFAGISSLFYLVSGSYVTPAMVLFWAFLVIRVVQGESLVGDRQWWVTKPYEWQKLFAAKLLFFFVFISVPLFHVHLFLLHSFGFPILLNLWSLLLMQFALFLAYFVTVLLLASLTKSFAQALLTIAGILVLVAGIAWLASKIFSGDRESPPKIVEDLQNCLLWGTFITVPIWQFARRRRWASCGTLLGVLAVNSLITLVVPNAKTMEKDYPLMEAPAAPAKIAIRQPAGMTRQRDANAWSDVTSDVYLSIPLTVSGVPPGTMVMVDVSKITTDSPQNSRWNRGWKYQHVQFWPEDELKALSYQVDRKEYEKIKNQPMNFHIELALSEYQEADARVLSIPAVKFVDETLGICRVDPRQLLWLQCLKPLHAPGLMATFDPGKSPCAGQEINHTIQEDVVSHAWEYPNHHDFPDPNVTPIVDYSIWFYRISLLSDLHGKPQQRTKSVILCPGSEIRLARPELKRQARIKLDMPNVRLQDLTQAF